MIPELENLITLQKLDLQIRAVEIRLARIPVEVEELEKEVATERANVKAAGDRLGESQKQRRAMEGELEQMETSIAKYKDQLMQVKTNDEYKAMQKQIENSKEEIGKKEEDILVGMDEADRFQEQLKLREKELEEGQKKVTAMEADLEKEATRLRTELETETSGREKLLATIDAALLAQYRKVSDARSGIAMAEAKDEHCEVCHVRLRPQVYNEIRVGKEILNCDSCGRIMYYLGPSPGHGGEADTNQPAEST